MSPVVPPISVMMTSASEELSLALDAVLDFVGDVRDHLHGLAEVFAAAFVGQDRLVDLAAGEIVGSGEHALVNRS